MSKREQNQSVVIGRRIRDRRKDLGLSQSDLAEKLGLSYQQVQNYENGTTDLTVGRLCQIASSLDVRPEFFLQTLSEPAMTQQREKLSAEEKRLVRLYRQIPNPPLKSAVLKIVQGLRGEGKKSGKY